LGVVVVCQRGLIVLAKKLGLIQSFSFIFCSGFFVVDLVCSAQYCGAEICSSVLPVLPKSCESLGGLFLPEACFDTLFLGPGGIVTKTSVKLGAKVLQFAYIIVYRENNKEVSHPVGLGADREFLEKLNVDQRKAFDWVCDGYRSLSGGGSGTYPVLVFCDFVRRSLDLLKKADPQSYCFLSKLVGSSGVLLLPDKACSQDAAVRTFVNALSGTRQSMPLLDMLSSRFWSVLTLVFEWKPLQITAIIGCASTVFQLMERFGYRVGVQKKIQTEAGATCVAPLVGCQTKTPKADFDVILLSSTGLLFTRRSRAIVTAQGTANGEARGRKNFF
jgi:hypothetical protein